MSPMGSLRTALALAVAAALLPAYAASASASAPSPPPATNPGGRLLADTVGDGIDDLVDGCPTVASGNPTGCPSASRTVSLKWLAGKKRLQARVSSPVAGCSQRARIALWRVR